MNKFDTYLNATGEIGSVTQVIDAIVYAQGLPGAKLEEIIMFENEEIGQVTSLLADSLEILTFSKKPIRTGTRLARTNSTLKIPVGEALLGKVIDPFGNLLASSRKIENLDSIALVNSEPKGIMQRKAVNRYLETGTSIVDLMVPLGKGQKELLIGDRKIGKTNFLLHTILTQARQGNIAIYACIGKRKIDIKQAEEFFKTQGIMDKVIIVASTATDAAGVIYITPYSAMAMAEYFRDKGQDVLLVLDDMLTHAKFYREISLLGKRFPGRNSYPGDIFHAHAKLLERAGNFVTKDGEVSITCLPTVETAQGDLSGYIQTNMMSMTDGHIFFDSNLFYQGRRPAINPFLSVSRIGRQTQSELNRGIDRELTSFLTLYEKIQSFIHFGSELNDSAKATLQMGDKILTLFHQPLNEIIPVNVQVIILALLWAKMFENEPITKVVEKREKLASLYTTNKTARNELDKFLSDSPSFNDLLEKLKTENKIVTNIFNL